jgi:hypothetical protein
VRRWVLPIVLGLVFVISIAAGAWVLAPDRGDTAARDTSASNSSLALEVERDPDVPDLPFDDNPDPAQCGIPVQWGKSDATAWLTGMWDGMLVQSDVLLYDSHLRTSIVGSAPDGTEVEIILFQENPVLDYYFVRVPGPTPQEGWVPAPFVSFEPAG